MPCLSAPRANAWPAGLWRALGRFRDNSASSAVEFAMISWMLIPMLLMMVEIGYIYFAKAELARIGQVAALAVETEQAQAESAAQFQSTACGTIAVILQCSNLWISVAQQTNLCGSVTTTIPSLTLNSAGVITSPATGSTYNPGVAGNIEVVQLLYPLPVFGAQLFGWALPNNNGVLVLASTFVVANEP